VYVNSKTLHKTEKTSSNANLLQRVKSRVQANRRSSDVLVVPLNNNQELVYDSDDDSDADFDLFYTCASLK
jgi:hypothetical protein